MTTVPPDGDPATWARRLQLTRAAQWFAGNHGDPYALILRAETDDPTPYERQVAAQPLFRSEQLDTWVTGDAALAREVLTDDRFGWLTRAGQRPAERTLPLAGTALDHGPEARRRLDALTAPGGPVLRADAEGARARVEETTAALLDGLGERFDLAVLARRLVASVLADLLGVPAARRGRFTEALAAAGRTLDSRLCPQTVANALATVAATAELTGLLGEVPPVTPPPVRPGPATPSAAGEAAPEGGSGVAPDAGPGVAADGPASADDRLAAALALAVGTAEPATTLLCNAVRALLDRPGQWALLREGPGRAAVVVEETLRCFPPVRLESRVVQQDVILAGQFLPADSHLVVLVAMANRGPRAVTDPDRDGFHPGGSRAPALGMTGVPQLAGAGSLIRLVVTTALRTLGEAVPALRPASGGVRWRRSPVLLGHARFPVTRAGDGGHRSDDRPATEEAARCAS
ncbi:P450-derived glycosyltransferase activator [Micromonospora sp. KC207]|uniref:cytochrome P450 family protein n=1 Tax=Micromonospora sp. KC207 TaxID=2530377 RepID=UPI00104C67D2|nr:P450-derived glycosyltransferase activator [Micromonospora sp. KC207]TDC52219.1 P450-derived glycosyltransferase activator [Micromonospora sp. KC207]